MFPDAVGDNRNYDKVFKEISKIVIVKKIDVSEEFDGLDLSINGKPHHPRIGNGKANSRSTIDRQLRGD